MSCRLILCLCQGYMFILTLVHISKLLPLYLNCKYSVQLLDTNLFCSFEIIWYCTNVFLVFIFEAFLALMCECCVIKKNEMCISLSVPEIRAQRSSF